MKKRAVFLDRDGVLNLAIECDGIPRPPKSLDDVVMPNDAVESLCLLKNAGYQLIVVTNQPDVKRGRTTKEIVEGINIFLQQQLPIDAFYTCYHDNSDGCVCRKPKPGLIYDAAKEHNINLLKSFMIGDRWKDIEAGRSANCKTIFLDSNYAESRNHVILADCIVTSLAEATHYILSSKKGIIV